MTLTAHFIEGDRRQACKNDGISIVSSEGRYTELLAILPLSEVPGETRTEQLKNAVPFYTSKVLCPS